jgi:hypothetical protein
MASRPPANDRHNVTYVSLAWLVQCQVSLAAVPFLIRNGRSVRRTVKAKPDRAPVWELTLFLGDAGSGSISQYGIPAPSKPSYTNIVCEAVGAARKLHCWAAAKRRFAT